MIGKMIRDIKAKQEKMGTFCPKSVKIDAVKQTGTPCWSSESLKPGKQTKTNP
jgi:hypothetical protein